MPSVSITYKDLPLSKIQRLKVERCMNICRRMGIKLDLYFGESEGCECCHSVQLKASYHVKEDNNPLEKVRECYIIQNSRLAQLDSELRVALGDTLSNLNWLVVYTVRDLLHKVLA